MSDQGKDFLKKLLETFQVEAEEHLQVLSSGLLALEGTAAAPERAAVVETVYREAHSLKGAARAVNMTEIESICQSMESVFAALKRQEATPSLALFDTLHRAIDVMREILGAGRATGGSDPDRTAEVVHRLLLAETSGSLATSDAAPALVESAVGPARAESAGGIERAEPQPAESPTTPPEIEVTSPPREAAPAPARQPVGEKPAGLETVRIAAAKLDSLLLQAEEMVAVKLTTRQRAADLREVEEMLDKWHKAWVKAQPELRAARQRVERCKRQAANDLQLSKLLEIVDAHHQHVRSLESPIAALARSADHDQHAFGAMVDNLLEDMKKILVLPFGSLLEIFPKLVRDLSRNQEKDVALEIRGADIEIDRRILEEMKTPLIHLVRNCIDHGLEKPAERTRAGKPARATIGIAVSQLTGNSVEILVSDDGTGIDVAKVRQAALRRRLVSEEEAAKLSDAEATALIFQSEVSTSPIITDLSGRGLGLAIVREKVEKLGGHVAVKSTPGGGTTFQLVLPLTLTTFRGILVEVAGRPFVVPTSSVERVTRIRREEIRAVESKASIALNGRAVALVSLADVLGLARHERRQDSGYVSVLVLGADDKRIAFDVDAVLQEQEVLVKPLGKNLLRVRNIAGATVLGSGRVVPILSARDLLVSAVRMTGDGPRSVAAERTETKRHSILVAEDSITSRMLLKNILESAGYEVTTALDGMDALTALKNGSFDLLVSDIEMPRLSGFELVAKVRADKKLANLPVVMVTSLESRADRERGIDVGASAYLVKSSFDQSNLLEVVHRLL